MRPYVFVYGQTTLDGKTATGLRSSSIPMMAFEGDDARRLRHTLRARSDAIMVGSRTIASDDPLLTVRHIIGRNPLRVVIDSTGGSPTFSKVLTDGLPTLLVVSERRFAANCQFPPSVEVLRCGLDRIDLLKLMNLLKLRGLNLIMLEGGGRLIRHALSLDLIDAIIVQTLPIAVGGEGLPTLVGGSAVQELNSAFKFKLHRIGVLGSSAITSYTRCSSGPSPACDLLDDFLQTLLPN